jgi:hypothetical protein
MVQRELEFAKQQTSEKVEEMFELKKQLSASFSKSEKA